MLPKRALQVASAICLLAPAQAFDGSVVESLNDVSDADAFIRGHAIVAVGCFPGANTEDEADLFRRAAEHPSLDGIAFAETTDMNVALHLLNDQASQPISVRLWRNFGSGIEEVPFPEPLASLSALVSFLFRESLPPIVELIEPEQAARQRRGHPTRAQVAFMQSTLPKFMVLSWGPLDASAREALVGFNSGHPGIVVMHLDAQASPALSASVLQLAGETAAAVSRSARGPLGVMVGATGTMLFDGYFEVAPGDSGGPLDWFVADWEAGGGGGCTGEWPDVSAVAQHGTKGRKRKGRKAKKKRSKGEQMEL